jgi:hypothetical protein
MNTQHVKAQHISRRTMLKGLGTVAIGLPFLEEMLVSTAAAQQQVVPVRAFNVFFGLGIPAPLQAEGFNGVLEPLEPLSKKLLIMRNVDQVRCDQPGINAHYDGSSGAFTAEPPNGTAKTGGPSLDQVIRRAHYPNGLPPGVVPTLVAGTYFRRDDRVTRYVHSYNEDGTVAAAMQEKPRDLFERIFGTITSDPKTLRQRRSVLDSVVDQYKFYTGKNSPLGAASKARIAEHLDRIREFEQRAFKLQEKQASRPCPTPGEPPDSKLIHGPEADPGGEGIDINLADLTEEWRLMADLYALAIQCDRARFGSITFLSAGERIRLKGKYEYGGKALFEFDDGAQHKASGAAGCSHEWWHKFNEEKKNEQLRAHAHMKMREVAYFLKRLDEAVEANGKTVLENCLITISTESGDGRHDNVKRELSGVFHAITSANGRFKTGQIMEVGAEGLDVYNTMLTAMGASRSLGPSGREKKAVDTIRA